MSAKHESVIFWVSLSAFLTLAIVVVTYSFVPYDKFSRKIDKHTGSHWRQRWIAGFIKIEDRIIESPLRLRLQKLGIAPAYTWAGYGYSNKTILSTRRFNYPRQAMMSFPHEFQAYWLETATDKEVLSFMETLPSQDHSSLNEWLTTVLDQIEKKSL